MRYSATTNAFYHPGYDGASVPADLVEISAELYAAMLDGQAAGRRIVPGSGGLPELIDPPAPGPVVPASVSRFQARAALMDAGLLADVELAVANSGAPLIQLAWAEAAEFQRQSPTIAALAADIGLTGEQVDQLFITAAQITA